MSKPPKNLWQLLGQANLSHFLGWDMVVGVGAVLHRVDPSGRRDQEVGRQPQGAPGKSQAEMTVRHTAHPGPQGLGLMKPSEVSTRKSL